MTAQHTGKWYMLLCLFVGFFVFFPGNYAVVQKTHPANGKLKIFILAGQSNMIGHGTVEGGTGTMEHYVQKNPFPIRSPGERQRRCGRL